MTGMMFFRTSAPAYLVFGSLCLALAAIDALSLRPVPS